MNKDILFLTENGFNGKVPDNFKNMRTEFAWMNALNAYHENLQWKDKLLNDNFIKKFDYCFIIWPKNEDYYKKKYPLHVINYLHKNDIKVLSIQEGPSNYFENYDKVQYQLNYLEGLEYSDYVLGHNKADIEFYKGILEEQENIDKIPTLLIDNNIKDIKPKREDKVLVGGNITRWYNGYESYKIAEEFDIQIDVFKSGRAKPDENKLFDNVYEWRNWTDWMKKLSEYKYAVNMMNTVAAGSFSLSCAYFGIPCIGISEVDTQELCFPDISVDNSKHVVFSKKLVNILKNDSGYYDMLSEQSKQKFKEHFSKEVFIDKMNNILEDL